MRAFVQIRQYLTSTQLQSAEIEELKAKVKALEMGSENTLGAVNDLSEDLQKDIDNIYIAIAELSVKLPQLNKPRRPIGCNIERPSKMEDK